MLLHAALAFAALFWLDFVWARYTAAPTAGRRIPAANYACAIILLSGAAAITYVNDPWMLLPAMAGAWCGTYVGARMA